jgi:hypothetical protein
MDLRNCLLGVDREGPNIGRRATALGSTHLGHRMYCVGEAVMVAATNQRLMV